MSYYSHNNEFHLLNNHYLSRDLTSSIIHDFLKHLFPLIQYATPSRRLIFAEIETYFTKHGILPLSAEFLAKQLPQVFDSEGNAKNYLRRLLNLKAVCFSPPIPNLPLSNAIYTLIYFHVVHTKKQRGRGTLIISMEGRFTTLKIYEDIIKTPMDWKFRQTTEDALTFQLSDLINNKIIRDKIFPRVDMRLEKIKYEASHKKRMLKEEQRRRELEKKISYL